MAREERFHENHENYSEYFPVLNKVKRRQPKFSKSSATLVSTLTVAASVALVTALFLVCRVLSIEPTCIKLEVNSQGGSAPVQYAVIRSELLSGIEDGCLPDLSEADKTGTLRGGTEIITADGLVPSMDYTVLFWTVDENGLEIVRRNNYKSGTPADNVYIEPPAPDAPSAAPPASAAPVAPHHGRARAGGWRGTDFGAVDDQHEDRECGCHTAADRRTHALSHSYRR